MKSNSLLALKALVTRNVKLFLKDKVAVMFSMLAPLIVFILYILFLGDLQVDQFNISELIEKYNLSITQADVEPYIGAFINNWMVAGVMGVSCITVAFNANFVMVKDKEIGAINDVFAAPVKRWVIFAGYICSCFLITTVICMFVLTFSMVYLACTGGFMMSFVDVLAIIGITLLSIISSSFMAVFITSFVKTTSALSSIVGVLSAAIGFFTGSYLPAFMMPKFIQGVICFIPGSYSSGLYRQYFLRGPIQRVAELVNNPKAVAELMGEYSITMDFFGTQVSWGWMVLALGLSIVLFAVALMIFYSGKKGNIFSHKRKKRK